MAGVEWKPYPILCRYYIHGVCREGENCRYSHSTSDAQQNVCKFYQKGCCTYGDKCRYDHVKPRTSSPLVCPASSASSHRPSPSATVTPIKSSLTPLSKPKPMLLPKDDEGVSSRMVSLTRQGLSSDSGIGDELAYVPSPTARNPEEWAKAAEFVPGQPYRGALPPSYLAMAQTGVENISLDSLKSPSDSSLPLDQQLCPYAAHGECWYGENCVYLHGDICDLCGKSVMHPTDTALQQKHTEECVKQHERDMEISFAVQRSKDKVCGICMETVWEKKPPQERKFGILSDCSHIFCLSCIRKWRANKQFENKTIRSCPECRTPSNFVTPSKYWIQEKSDKEKLITGYKDVLGQKHCKYFDFGKKECPFNENCFYLHAYPDGRKASPKPMKRRRRENANGELDLIQQIILWDFFEDRNSRLTFDFEWDEDFDALLFHSTLFDVSSDDSDSSDFEGF